MFRFLLGAAVGFGAAFLLLKRDFDLRVEDIRIEEMMKRAKDARKYEKEENINMEAEAEEAMDKYKGIQSPSDKFFGTENAVDKIIYEIDPEIMGHDNYEMSEVIYDPVSKNFVFSEDGELILRPSQLFGYFCEKFYSFGMEGVVVEETFLRNENTRTDYDIIITELEGVID